MRDIEVPAEDDRLFLFQLAEVLAKRGIPFTRPVIKTEQLTLRVRRIDIHEKEVGELDVHDAPLGIEIRLPHSQCDIHWLLPGEDGCAGIALLLGGIPETLEAIRPIDLRHLVSIRLGLLQADHVRSASGHEIKKAAPQHCSNTIHIPGNQFHAGKVWHDRFAGKRNESSDLPVDLAE